MKNMKKILSVILTAALLLSAVCFPSMAEEEGAFRFVATATVNEDATSVTLTVAVQNNPGFNGAKLKIGYNADVFSVLEVENYSGMSLEEGPPTKNPYVLLFAKSSLVKKDVVMATMTFSVRENVGAFAETFTLTVEDCKADSQTLSPAVASATCAAVVGYTPNGEGDFTYTVSSDGATLTGYVGSDANAVVPAALGGLPVIAVAEGAFAGANVSKVLLPSTVSEIASGAFVGCKAVEYTVPNPNCSIAADAFSGTPASAKFRGFANLEAAVSSGFVALHGIVSADMYQYSLDGGAFRVINSLATVGGIRRVGIRVTRTENGSTLTGETHQVMYSVTNYIGDTVDASNPYISFEYLYVGLVSAAGLTDGETFVITPYAVAMDGTVYYGENAVMTYEVE